MQIQCLSFDKVKIVASYKVYSTLVHCVFEVASGRLLTSMHNRYDKTPWLDNVGVHLATNGKIVVDAR